MSLINTPWTYVKIPVTPSESEQFREFIKAAKDVISGHEVAFELLDYIKEFLPEEEE